MIFNLLSHHEKGILKSEAKICLLETMEINQCAEPNVPHG